MIRVLDLHGLNEVQATGKIMMYLNDFLDQHGYESCEIITGKGEVLRRVAQDLIEDDPDLTWEYNGSNKGSLIIRRSNE